jgi:hypothetical protein
MSQQESLPISTTERGDPWISAAKLPDVPKLMPTTYDLEQRLERVEEKLDELRELVEKMHNDLAGR